MPRFIMVTDSPNHSHATHVSIDEIVRLLRGPFGYTDVVQCLAMIEAPQQTNGSAGYVPFPLHPAPWGTMVIHVEGLMDLEKQRFSQPCERCHTIGKACNHRRGIEWMEAGHRCQLACLVPGSTRHAKRSAT
jgi:hypothetical protein